MLIICVCFIIYQINLFFIFIFVSNATVTCVVLLSNFCCQLACLYVHLFCVLTPIVGQQDGKLMYKPGVWSRCLSPPEFRFWPGVRVGDSL